MYAREGQIPRQPRRHTRRSTRTTHRGRWSSSARRPSQPRGRTWIPGGPAPSDQAGHNHPLRQQQMHTQPLCVSNTTHIQPLRVIATMQTHPTTASATNAHPTTACQCHNANQPLRVSATMLTHPLRQCHDANTTTVSSPQCTPIHCVLEQQRNCARQTDRQNDRQTDRQS